ncbi:FtsX-like permease family protein [Actinokineospora auranticolor]|uniref:Putative ABC transport system permease protein n=1 Tax=Actinokineospora auranticolor TaxID=155976 RepID=A0A2S6GUK8_9PSEU|nr:FtsX-like permease family protein [Actinokineospora auranticolor]PPK68879.1 putative ABC transport system permease protein [Actinokineospora auranticolor]
MFGLAMRTLRFRKGGFLGTFIAVFFGAMLVAACGGLMETGIRTALPPERMTGADLQVIAAHSFELIHRPARPEHDDGPDYETATLPERVRLDRDLADGIRAVQGVRAATPSVNFPVVVGKNSTSGHNWESTGLGDYRLDGAAPRAGQVVVAPATGVGIGDRVTVLARGTAVDYTVSGVADMAGAPPAVFFADADVPRLAGRSTVDSFGVVAEPGTDLEALSGKLAALQGVEVLSGDERGLAEHPEAEFKANDLIVLAAVTGGLATMVAMFVVSSTLGLSIQQRGKELALLRAVGTTPRQLRRMVLLEAFTVALLATALGCWPGRWVGQFLFDRLASRGVVPDELRFHLGWIPVVVAIGASLLTTLVGAAVTARRAARTRPTEALAETAMERRWLSVPRALLAALAFGGGTALVIVTVTVMSGPVAASTAGPSVMLWAVAVALVCPGLTKLVLGVIRLPLRAVSGIPGELGLLNSRARTVRVAAAVMPIMLATGVTVANIYLQTTQTAIAREAYAQTLRADAVIGSATGGLPRDLLAKVRATPGVTAAAELAATRMFVIEPFDDSQNDDGYDVQAVGGDIAETTAVTVKSGSLDGLTGATVALPESMEHKVGDRMKVRLGDGAFVDVTVVATFTGVKGFENVLMPADLVVPHVTEGLPDQILVRGDVSAVAAVAAAVPGAYVGDRAMLTAAFEEGQQIGAWVNYLIVGMIMAYTVISVVNTLVMATVKRKREFGLQRLTGSSRAQVMRMMGVEATAVALIGLVLGTLVAALTLVPYSLAAQDSLLPSGSPWVYLTVLIGMAVLVLAATLFPAWTATRARPVDAAALPD